MDYSGPSGFKLEGDFCIRDADVYETRDFRTRTGTSEAVKVVFKGSYLFGHVWKHVEGGWVFYPGNNGPALGSEAMAFIAKELEDLKTSDAVDYVRGVLDALDADERRILRGMIS